MSMIRSDNLKLLLIENIGNDHTGKFSFYRYGVDFVSVCW
jgi:hypothetical protein